MNCIPALSCNWFFSRASTRSKHCLSFLLCTHSLPISLSRALTHALFAFSLHGNLTEARFNSLFSADTLTHITQLTYNNCQTIRKVKKDKESTLRNSCDRTESAVCATLGEQLIKLAFHLQSTHRRTASTGRQRICRWDLLPVSIYDLN